MATNTGKEVGRVSIRVLPNSTKFRADLKKVLDRAEATMSVAITAHVNRQEFDREIDRMVRDANNRKLTFNADADTGHAREQIAVAARDRIVTLNVRVAKASLASVGTALAAISGARLAGTVLQDIGRGLANLDKNLPKLAAVGLGVANITSVLLSSVGGIVTVGAGLGSIIGVLGAAPGILAGFAVGAITLAVALKDAKEQLSDLAPAWTDLGDVISANFWERARQPIIDLNNSLLPSLQSGLASTAAALGQWAGALASGFQAALGGGRIDRMLAKLNESIDIAAGGTASFASAISTLGEVGANNLPRLATWVSKLTSQFDGWIQTVSSDGSLQRWIDNGVASAKDLGRALKGTGGILKGIFRAAEASGGQGLRFLADELQKVSDIVNGPGFQKALTTLFEGAAEGANGLAGALGPLGEMFATLAPSLSKVLASGGATVGKLLGDIANALSNPIFAVGLESFFAGIESGLAAIGPSLPLLGATLGILGTTLGDLAGAVGPVIAALAEGLAPVLDKVLLTLQPLLPILGEALVTAVQTVAPALLDLAIVVLPELAATVILLVPLVQNLADGLAGDLAPALGDATVGMLGLVQAFLIGSQFLLGDTSIDQMTAKLRVLPGVFGDAIRSGLSFSTQMGRATGEVIVYFMKLSGDVGARIGEVAAIIATLPARAASALSGLGGLLVASGKSLIQGFINGILSMVPEVAAAAGRVVAAAGDFFPHSPARKGEFSGRGWTLYSGRATVAGYVEGMRRETASLRAQANATTAAARLGVGFGSEGARAAGTGANITQYITTPPNEDPRILGRINARELIAQMAGG